MLMRTGMRACLHQFYIQGEKAFLIAIPALE
jgi:hypothetical protein